MEKKRNIILMIFIVHSFFSISQSKNIKIENLKKQNDSIQTILKVLKTENQVSKIEIDSLRLVLSFFEKEIEAEKISKIVLENKLSELDLKLKTKDSLYKEVLSTINKKTTLLKYFSDSLKKTNNSIEVIEKIVELRIDSSYTKSIYTKNSKDFFKIEKDEWDYDWIKYIYFFNSDSILYKLEISPSIPSNNLHSDIYFDYYGSTVLIKHSTYEIGRDENSTTHYYDEYDCYFFSGIEKEIHRYKTTEDSWNNGENKFCEAILKCNDDDHKLHEKVDGACDLAEIFIRNRLYTNRDVLLNLIKVSK